MEKEKSRNKMKTESVFLACLLTFFLLSLSVFVIATPTGPTGINITSNTTKQTTNGMMVNISGGYIAKLNVTASVQNPHWKAFVGWIQGSFTLEDATGSTIYDWSMTSVGGEIYTTRQSGSVNWGTISCADDAEVVAEETVLMHDGEDGINETFTASSNAKPFYVGTTSIGAGACYSTQTNVNNQTPVGQEFEEVILHDTSNIIFASILEEGGSTGYDGIDYDFQMIVPENGSSSWTGATPYYLYVELD